MNPYTRLDAQRQTASANSETDPNPEIKLKLYMSPLSRNVENGTTCKLEWNYTNKRLEKRSKARFRPG